MQSAVREVGPAARIVGANRVRKGGLGGFFAREHIEVEVEVDGPAGAPSGDDAGPRRTRGGRRASAEPRADAREAAAAAQRENDDFQAAARVDPMAALIEEMAGSGPSSVLDLAERVNREQSRFALKDDDPRVEPVGRSRAGRAGGRPAAVTEAVEVTGRTRAAKPGDHRPPVEDDSDGFAAVLARIAREAGLAPGVDDDRLVGRPLPQPELVRHSGAILNELDGGREIVPAVAGQRAPISDQRVGDYRRADERTADERTADERPRTADHRAEDRLPSPAPTLPTPQRQLGEIGVALHQLGLPLPACQSVMPAADRESLQREVAEVLRACLPALPPTPQAPTSVIAVVGPRGQVMATARALAAEMGGSAEDVALATTRKVWRPNEQVIPSAEIALEHRRSWRWRNQPSVVAVESDVRPAGASWALGVLRALEPTLCWGVVSAAHKPEDLAAWSQSLGGLDVIALVDLDSTTTPAAALAAPVPVGRLEDEPATPEQWAKILCERLLG